MLLLLLLLLLLRCRRLALVSSKLRSGTGAVQMPLQHTSSQPWAGQTLRCVTLTVTFVLQSALNCHSWAGLAASSMLQATHEYLYSGSGSHMQPTKPVVQNAALYCRVRHAC
jgi:hypothetical protein